MGKMGRRSIFPQKQSSNTVYPCNPPPPPQKKRKSKTGPNVPTSHKTGQNSGKRPLPDLPNHPETFFWISLPKKMGGGLWVRDWGSGQSRQPLDLDEVTELGFFLYGEGWHHRRVGCISGLCVAFLARDLCSPISICIHLRESIQYPVIPVIRVQCPVSPVYS